MNRENVIHVKYDLQRNVVPISNDPILSINQIHQYDFSLIRHQWVQDVSK